jgi:hypothetical protein
VRRRHLALVVARVTHVHVFILCCLCTRLTQPHNAFLRWIVERRLSAAGGNGRHAHPRKPVQGASARGTRRRRGIGPRASHLHRRRKRRD